jgi:hypothetical protein
MCVCDRACLIVLVPTLHSPQIRPNLKEYVSDSCFRLAFKNEIGFVSYFGTPIFNVKSITNTFNFDFAIWTMVFNLIWVKYFHDRDWSFTIRVINIWLFDVNYGLVSYYINPEVTDYYLCVFVCVCALRPKFPFKESYGKWKTILNVTENAIFRKFPLTNLYGKW